MMVRTHCWSDEELMKLAAVIASGGSALRAAAALNRRVRSCQRQAQKMGTPFKPLKLVRRTIKEKCEEAAREAAGR
jgi:GcrA cell cycle regulator